MIRVNATSPIHVFQENKQDKQWSSPFKYLAFNHVPFNHFATAHGNGKITSVFPGLSVLFLDISN
jgi:hypothetical protein